MSVLDFNVKVTIEAPALVDAINRLCDRPMITQAPAAPSVAPSTQNVVELPTANTAPAEAPAEAPASVTPPPADPTPTAKTVDLETISRAGAALIDQGKLPQVLAVLKEFGVEAITQLQPTTYPAFAERLKALGATL